jgi:predicted phage terminase large subunit-like protein
MLKVGDKIELKKPKEPTGYEETVSNILSLLRQSKKDDKLRLQWCKTAYDVLEAYYDSSKEFGTDDLDAVMIAKNKFLPILKKMIEEAKVDNMASFFDIYKMTYAFCGRRDFESFIDYMEWERPVKVLPTRREALAPFIYYLGKTPFDRKLKLIEASYAPSTGKSFVVNYFSAWSYGLFPSDSILRISYSDELVLGFSRSIKDIVSSHLFADVFKDYKLFNGKPFDKEKESDWKIKSSDTLVSHYSRTREGAITGVRAKWAIILDDIIKGETEATNEALHRSIYNKYLTEWSNRKDGDKTIMIALGTMWSPYDILNKIREAEEKKGELIDDDKFKYVKKNKKGTAVFIAVPALDENDESTIPLVNSTEYYRDLRDELDPYFFSCVYQQEPIAPTGLEFSYDNLRTYKDIPKDENGEILGENYCMAVLDPARKGKDNVSMPIFKTFNDGHYFWDCIFKQKPMTELYDEIVDKIIGNMVTKLVLENNTDTSLKTVIEGKLKEKGYLLCEIIEKYNTINKEQRIKDNRGIVQRNLVFRDKSLVKPNTDEGKFMDNLTKYSFDYANKHDDAPDSVCMYASEIVLGKGYVPKVEPTDRRNWGF